MHSRDFCFWLQGLLEVAEPTSLNERQVAIIKQHLGLVFQHDPAIDSKACKHSPVAVVNPPLDFRFIHGEPSKEMLIC